MKIPKVVISNSVRQYSHQTTLALQEGDMLEKYFISIWYKPASFPYSLIKGLPPKVRFLLLNELRKRYFKDINSSKVIQNPWVEIFIFIFRKIFKLKITQEAYSYLLNKNFDNWVAKKLKYLEFDIFIGYETSSLESFKMCKKKKSICILDLGSLHWARQRAISMGEQKLGFRINDVDTKTLDKIIEMKIEELNISDYIFVPSLLSKNALLEKGIDERKILHIPFGVDLNLFKQKDAYEKRKDFKILFTGSIRALKGIFYLLEAYRQLKLENSELLLIGNMMDDVSFLKNFKGLFRHIPYLHHAQLVRYYQEADLCIFPSLIEGFSQAVLEPMATGTPVIVSDHTGSHEIVRDNTDGFVITVRDITALKEKILFFYNNREKIEEFGKNARSQVGKYSWETYRENIRKAVMDIYHKKNEGSSYNA